MRILPETGAGQTQHLQEQKTNTDSENQRRYLQALRSWIRGQCKNLVRDPHQRREHDTSLRRSFHNVRLAKW